MNIIRVEEQGGGEHVLEPWRKPVCPARAYIATLASGGRASMESALRKVATILAGESCDPEKIDWSQIRAYHLDAVRAALLEKKQAPATVNLALAAMKGVARAAWALEMITDAELMRIRGVSLVKGHRVPAGRDVQRSEVARLFEACADGTSGGARDAAVFALMVGAGLRRAEVVGLYFHDYNRESGRLMVRGKGNKERALYLANGTAEALDAWLAYRGDGAGPLFFPVIKGGHVEHKAAGITPQALYFALKKRAERAGLKSFSPHDLRRAFVGDALDGGIDLATVQALAGHASPTTTARYDRRGERAAKAAAAVICIPYVAPEQS